MCVGVGVSIAGCPPALRCHASDLGARSCKSGGFSLSIRLSLQRCGTSATQATHTSLRGKFLTLQRDLAAAVLGPAIQLRTK